MREYIQKGYIRIADIPTLGEILKFDGEKK